MIDPNRVEELILECLPGDSPEEGSYVVVEGITVRYGLRKDKLEEHKAEIWQMLLELPDEFRSTTGGGWTFLNAAYDRHGNQWTGLHQRMEQLFCLGIGLGIVEWLLSRESWAAMPGGVPYVVIKDQEYP